MPDRDSDNPEPRKTFFPKAPPNWRFVLMLAAAMAGGGGLFGWKVVPAVNGEETAIERHEKGPVHAEITKSMDDTSKTLDSVEKKLKVQGQDIKNNEKKIDKVQDTLHNNTARQEARRVTADIQSRSRQINEYDRIVRINFTRLKSGREPCANVACEN
jgi:hypothetical protein